jgi:dTDP-4-dehydrorhamnose 3,5-epimerase
VDVIETILPEVKLLHPKQFRDSRGIFAEIYNRGAFARLVGPHLEFVQDNVSTSMAAGTVRGLHFQRPPHAQAKLVSVMRGRVLDVAVDLRHGSPEFGRHVALELTAEGGEQLFIPAGFAHGFCTLEPNTTVMYKVDAYYAPQSDSGIAWDDPALGIGWPIAAQDAVVSEKDRQLPRLSELPAIFSYQRSPESIGHTA